MQFPVPLTTAILCRRYKRFLADVRLSDGREVTVHCPNPGAMTGLAEEGSEVFLSPARAGAKLPYGWKLSRLPSGAFVVIDTGIANGVVAEALTAGRIDALPPFSGFRAEVRLDAESRIDFCLDLAQGGPLWLEVKTVTLARGTRAVFPDSKTLRGAKHLRALTEVVRAGGQADMLYLLARDDCDEIGIAEDIDPAYGAAFREARAAGVQMLGLGCAISPAGVLATHAVPVT